MIVPKDQTFRANRRRSGTVGIGNRSSSYPFIANPEGQCRHLSYSLNSLKYGYIGDYIWDYYRGY